MSVSLAITDNTDGTGGVATVAGGGVSATNSLYRAPFPGPMGSQTWTLVGSRSGNGTISISSPTVPLGYYLWRVDSLASGVTEVATVYQNLTDAAAKSIMMRILEAVQTRIRALDLIDDSKVVVKWIARKLEEVDLGTMIEISPVNAESYPGILNNQDDIGLPVLVAIMDKQNQDYTLNLNRNTLWREKVLSALRFQRLAGVPEVTITYPEPAEIVSTAAWDKNLFYSPLIFRFITRTVRG